MANKKKGISFVVKGTVYPFDVLFSFGQSDVELLELLIEQGIKINEDDERLRFDIDKKCLEGRAFMLETGQTVVRMPVVPVYARTRGILAHEIFHAVEFILNRIGVRHHVRKSGEAYAYLIGYLTEQCYYELNQRK